MHRRQLLWAITSASTLILPTGLADTGCMAEIPQANTRPAGDGSLPNVVLVFTDDQGYADVGCFGARDFQTPNLDRMASEGTRFTSFCVAQAVCTASRAALMTGCYANRVSMSGALNHTSRTGIHPDEVLLPEICRSRGYANSIYVEVGGAKLLFDAGISGIQVKKRLGLYGRDAACVDAVLVSHDHVDHSRSVGTYLRKSGLPIYVTARTYRAVSRYRLGEINDINHFSAWETLPSVSTATLLRFNSTSP